MVPSAERQNATFPPVEKLPPASVDRFPCFHICPAPGENFPAVPSEIFLEGILYIPMVPSAERQSRPFQPVEILPPASAR